ncbi:hypothetical protein TRVL_09544 [Trypanosoma vivax]|nr:hypothetical protein TRVL_09544 [Trypanosoma vivax]
MALLFGNAIMRQLRRDVLNPCRRKPNSWIIFPLNTCYAIGQCAGNCCCFSRTVSLSCAGCQEAFIYAHERMAHRLRVQGEPPAICCTVASEGAAFSRGMGARGAFSLTMLEVIELEAV